jgi:F-type H+-transporting ATPase subunit b
VLQGLGIQLPVLITQLVSFLILFGLLGFVAYKPILKMLDERQRRIKESLDQAEAVKEQSRHREEELKKELQAAGQRGQEMITRANQAGEDIRRKAQEQAKTDAETLIARARQEIKTERDEAILELRKEFADVTILAASKVIGQTLDKESHKQLIDKVLKESQTLKES